MRNRRLLLLLLLLLALPVVAEAGFTYTTDNGAITITGFTGPDGAVSIPSAINGLPVTGIGSGAFTYFTTFTSVTIPSSVTHIGDGAFQSCTRLKRVYFQGNAPVTSSGFLDETSALVYYLPGTTGWGLIYSGRPTALWKPQVQASTFSWRRKKSTLLVASMATSCSWWWKTNKAKKKRPSTSSRN